MVNTKRTEKQARKTKEKVDKASEKSRSNEDSEQKSGDQQLDDISRTNSAMLFEDGRKEDCNEEVYKMINIYLYLPNEDTGELVRNYEAKFLDVSKPNSIYREQAQASKNHKEQQEQINSANDSILKPPQEQLKN